MSVLNGNISSEILVESKPPFGEPYKSIAKIDMKGATDCGFVSDERGDYLVVVGSGFMRVYEMKAFPDLCSELKDLGNSRQLSVSNGFAYVSSREDGVYIVDLKDVKNPKTIYRLDTQELATGICSANGILAVTNRHMGCELYDVKNPYRPKRIGDFLCGEAQSVWLYKKYAYIGDWINHCVRIVDVSVNGFGNEISRFNIDGFADGVCVFELPPDKYRKNGITVCLTASGHHSDRLKNRRKYQKYSFVTRDMLEDGYGCGHRVTITNVTDPRNPEFLSEIAAPPMFGGVDFWRVYAGHKKCWFADSMNGLFEIDLSDLINPSFSRRFRLPPNDVQFTVPPSIQIQCGSVTGMTAAGDKLCVVGDGEVYILDCEAEEKLVAPYSDYALITAYVPDVASRNDVFYDGTAHSFVNYDNKIFCAAGNDGIIALDMSGKPILKRKINGYCLDLIEHKGKIVSAEGAEGVAVYDARSLTELCRLKFGCGKSVRQIIGCGNVLVAELGCRSIQVIGTDEIDGKIALVPVGVRVETGLLYYRHLSETLVGKHIIANPLAYGPALFEADEKTGLNDKGLSLNLITCPFEEGACGYKNGIIFIHDKKYYYIDNPRDIAELPASVEVKGAALCGRPFVCENKLVLLNRISGVAEITDVSDPVRPKFLKSLNTGLRTEFVSAVNGELLIACGHGGIIKL